MGDEIMSKKGILFDFNGTMFFDSEKHKEAWDVFSRKYRNCPITEEELDHMHGKTNKKIQTRFKTFSRGIGKQDFCNSTDNFKLGEWEELSRCE